MLQGPRLLLRLPVLFQDPGFQLDLYILSYIVFQTYRESTIWPAPITPSRLTLCPAAWEADMENKRAEPVVDLEREPMTDDLNMLEKCNINVD